MSNIGNTGGIGGEGFPRPLPNEGGPRVALAGAVDLQMVKDRDRHQHRWIMLARFVVRDDTITAIVAGNRQAAEAHAAGLAVPDIHVPLDMSDKTMLAPPEGPGCVKCGAVFQGVAGALCPVDDNDIPLDWTQWTVPTTATEVGLAVPSSAIEAVERPKLTVVQRG